jgi:GAF domain-containing protein
MNYHEFTEQDERVLETLAAYAAVAITNARLYEALLKRDSELCQRNEDLKLLNDVAAALTGSLEVDEILDKTLDLVMSYLDVEAGEIFLCEEDEKILRLALHRGSFEENLSDMDRFRFGEGFIGMVASSGKPLVSSNLRQDMRYLRSEVLEAGFQSIACIPLAAGGKVVGVTGAATRRLRQYDEREIHILNAIGTWAGITIENARLSPVLMAILEERERIGMDLHDGIIQSIYGVGLALDYARVALEEDPKPAVPKIEQSISALNEIIHDLRSYILDLKPRRFHGDDLKEGLQRLVDEFQVNSNTRVLLMGPRRSGRFSSRQFHCTVHICQEAPQIPPSTPGPKPEVHP